MNTTQEIAIDFVQRAVNNINRQLAVEIERNGFSADLIRTGKQKLTRIVKKSETNPDFVAESFTVQAKNAPERIIMCVKWAGHSYSIEVNSDAVAGAVKVNKNFGIKKDRKPLFLGAITEREIEIEARASEYMKELERKEGVIIK